MEKDCKSVIYAIININNNKRYIGSTICAKRRFKEHFNFLNKNKHQSPYLQNAWNKYGASNFTFEIIEYVEDFNSLIEREQWWIDNTENIYNLSKTAGNNGIGILNYQSKKCYQYSLDGNFVKEWDSISDIERDLGLGNSLIVRCLKGKTRTAHKFQWFYEYKGEVIEGIKVKSTSKGTRNPELLEKMKLLWEEDKSLTFEEVSIRLDVKLSTVKNLWNKHKEYISGSSQHRRKDNTSSAHLESLKEANKKLKQKRNENNKIS